MLHLSQPFPQMPPTLSKTGGYEHREALFGVPPYGGSLQQNIYYADSELCEQNVNARTGYPIRPLNDEGKMEKWPSRWHASTLGRSPSYTTTSISVW